MTWPVIIAIGCVAGGAAVALIWGAVRVSKYCVSVWNVVASVQLRNRSAGADMPERLADTNPGVHERGTANDDQVGGGR